MLQFKPSVLAAASLLSMAYEFFPVQFPALCAAVSSCEFVDKANVWECSRTMCDVTTAATDICDDTTAMSFYTPVMILGLHCSSSESELVVRSSSDSRDMKKCWVSDLMFITSWGDKAWETYVKINKDAEGWRGKLYPIFDRLAYIFGKDRATGKRAQGPTKMTEAADKKEENMTVIDVKESAPLTPNRSIDTTCHSKKEKVK
ncbi:cyclin-D6-1-like [Canna indica]|uniref:Cyclin-D6-1-like n=1 Tax=Canna indica TaxID=4628 RepID=A0AAQ3KQY8_9LILI|nr:cyclin-D6-1-like [Canna indica]